jgi:hypothetical protein
MMTYDPVFCPYGTSKPDLIMKNERYDRHKEWIEPLVSQYTSCLSKNHIKTCECGAFIRLTTGILRRHFTSEKHLRHSGKWTDIDEQHSLEWKKLKTKPK